MEYKIYYNGQETSDFDTLASWFQELKKENERLKREYDIAQNHITENEDCIHSMSNDMRQVRNLNKSLENEIDVLKAEKRKTEEVLKRYCGDSVYAPIPTIVGLIIDDYFYQKAEAEFQIVEEQKAEKTIEKLNKELVEYADKVEKLEKCACSIPTFPTLAEKINDITCRYHMPVTPLDRRKARTEHIFQCVQELAEYAKKQRSHIYRQDGTIANQKERINELEEKLKNWEKKLWNPDWCRLIDKLDEIIDKEAPIPCQLRKVYTNAEDEIRDKLHYLAMSLCSRNVLNDVKNKRIRELENKVNELDVTNRKLKLENEKLKRTLEFCQKEASSAREHARNVEVNAERIRKGLD